MFLINVTQMIQDQMANAISSQEARGESRMPPGYLAPNLLLQAVEVSGVRGRVHFAPCATGRTGRAGTAAKLWPALGSRVGVGPVVTAAV